MTFTTKDSGQRQEYSSGMRRDLADNKPDLLQWMPMSIPYEHGLWYRMGMLAQRGAQKYGRRNWELAGEDPKSAAEELERFKSSALRHTMQWLHGETDEDHAAAVAFNLICAEMVKYKIEQRQLLSDAADLVLSKEDDEWRDKKLNEELAILLHNISEDGESSWTEDEHIERLLELDDELNSWPEYYQTISDKDFLYAVEQEIVTNHPDFAWVWEEEKPKWPVTSSTDWEWDE